MNDKSKIIAGLVLFLVLVTFPMWYTGVAGGDVARPVPELPAGETNCVKDKSYMTANHMKLLDEWRDTVVREGRKDVEIDGQSYEMSLTRTCLGCHTNKVTFCDRCHNYADVHPVCWNCHVEPKGN